MAAIASLEDLKEVLKDLNALKKADPKAYEKWVELLKKHRMVGYKNIAKLAMGMTPEKLKEAKSKGKED
jgi:hypothetical protein